MLRRVLAAAVVIVAATLAAVVWSHATPRPPVTPNGHLPWPSHVEARYGLEWRVREHVALPVGEGAAPDSTLSWKGTLKVERPDAAHVRFSLDGLDEGQLQLLGNDVPANAETFTHHQVQLSLDATGAVSQVTVEPGTPELTLRLLESLGRELVLERPSQPALTWNAQHVDQFGTAEVELSWAEEDLVVRKVKAMQRLAALTPEAARGVSTTADGTSTVRLTADGLPTEWTTSLMLSARKADGQTVLEASEQLSLHLESHGPYRPVATQFLPPPSLNAGNETKHLEERVGTLTAEQFKKDLEHLNGGVFPDHNKWLWQTTALLTLHPELCDEVVKRFADPKTTFTGRALAADLLAGAGTPEAQTALRTALDSPAAKGPGGEQLLQRFSLVQKPAAESAEWMAQRLRTTTDAIDKAASGASLGSMARHLAEWGDEDHARQYGQQLRDRLETATPGADRAYALRALGNVGSADNRALLVGALASTQAIERDAATFALRHDPSNDATTALLGATHDADPSVQATAFTVLAARPLDPPTLQQLLASVPTLGSANDHGLVTLLTPYLDQADVQATLKVIATRNPNDGELQGRVASMMLAAKK